MTATKLLQGGQNLLAGRVFLETCRVCLNQPLESISPRLVELGVNESVALPKSNHEQKIHSHPL